MQLGDYSNRDGDPSKGLQVYAIFKALAKMFTGLTGFYASYLLLQYQLLISASTLVIGSALVYHSERVIASLRGGRAAAYVKVPLRDVDDVPAAAAKEQMVVESERF